MAILLSTARQSLLNRKRDLSDVSTTVFTEWCNFVCDFAYDRIRGVDPERFMDSSTTYTVTSKPQTSALPADFLDMSEYGAGLFLIDSNGDDTNQRLTVTGPGRSDMGYYISGSNIIFTGMDNSSQFRLRYMPTRTRFTTSTDYFTLDTLTSGTEIIPERNLDYLVNALDVLYTVWDEQPGDESFADARFVRALDQMLQEIKRCPDSYQLPDFSQLY